MRLREFELVAGALMVICAAGILSTPLYGLDEVWVYQLSRRLVHGFTPYRDFYLLVFPFAFQLNAALLTLLSDQLLVMRSIAVVVSAATAVLIYVASRRIGVSRALCLLPLAAFVWAQFVSPYNSYTWFALAFLSAAMLTDVVIVERASGRAGPGGRTWHLALFVGFLLGLAALSKQHVGVAALAASIAFTLTAGPKDSRARPAIGRAGLVLLGFLAVVGAELVYLWSSDALGPFLKYTVYEARMFRSEAGAPYADLMGAPLSALVAILVPAALLFSLVWALWRRVGDGNSVLLLVSLYGMAGFIVVFPRSDLPHLFVAAPLALIGLSHWLSERVSALRLKWADFIVAFPLLLLFFAPLVRSQENIGALLRGEVRFSSLSHYAGIPIAPGLEGMISQVNDTIRGLEAEGKRVYFLEHSAALFLIPMDRFAGHFDVLLGGNFGAGGVEEVIRELAADDAAAVLILRGSHALEAKEIIAFVQTNMTQVGEVAGYEVYAH
jgi:hypothetical protein